MSNKIIELLNKLFIHRYDTYSTQNPDGSYTRVDEPITLEIIEKHLDGKITIGVYQAKDNTVRWIVFDYDGENKTNLQEAVKATYKSALDTGVPLKAMLVEDSGRRGYHLWIFMTQVPLSFAHELGMKIIQGATVSETVKNIHIEVFPKQLSIPAEGYGNLVKLPLGIHRKSGKRSFFVDRETFEPVNQDVIKNIVQWSPSGTMISEISVPQKPVEPLLSEDYPCWIKISEGKIPEGMRHDVAVAFASHLRDRGLSREIALIVAREWYRRLPQPPEVKTYVDWRDIEKAVNDTYKRGYHVGCKLIRSRWPELCSPLECPISDESKAKIKPTREKQRFVVPKKKKIKRLYRRELCDGTFILETHGPHTVLYSPIDSEHIITMRGRYNNWSMNVLESFAKNVSMTFKNKELDTEIDEIIDMIKQTRIEKEVKAIDEDSALKPEFLAEHTIEIRYSKKQNYIMITGETYYHRDILKQFMDWDAHTKAWRMSYSKANLKQAISFVEEYDTCVDPISLGKVQCWVCKTFTPKAQATQTKNGWYCGCLKLVEKEKLSGGEKNG